MGHVASACTEYLATLGEDEDFIEDLTKEELDQYFLRGEITAAAYEDLLRSVLRDGQETVVDEAEEGSENPPGFF
jgi:hypothetical protein